MASNPILSTNQHKRGGRLTKIKGKTVSIAPALIAGSLMLANIGYSQAANECGSVSGTGPVTINCDANSYSSISYSNNFSDDSTIIVNTNTINSNGIAFTHSNNQNDAQVTTEITAGDISAGTPGSSQSFAVSTSALTSGTVTSRLLNGSISLVGSDISTGSTPLPTALYSLNRGSGDVLTEMTGGSISASNLRTIGMLSIRQGSNIGATGDATARISGGEITVSGREGYGVYARNDNGSGKTLVEMNGGNINISGLLGFGLYARSDRNASGSTEVIMTDGTISTSNRFNSAIYVYDEGTGSASAQISGGSISISGDRAPAISSRIDNFNNNNDVSVTVSGGNISTTGRDSDGVYAQTTGSGNAIITGTGGSINTTGSNSHGVSANSRADVSIDLDSISITSGSGSAAAIISTANTNNNISIDSNAIINGSRSNRAIVDAGGSVASNIISLGEITGDILLNRGDDRVNLQAGVFTGDIEAGAGSDKVSLAAVTFDGISHVIDGGTDEGDDGLSLNNDLLQFNGWSGFGASQSDITLADINAQRNIQNFERIELNNNADITFSGNQFDVDINSNNVDLTVADGSTARFKESFSIQGDLNNFGSIDLSGANQTAGTTLTVGKNYTAGSNLYLDVALGGDSSPTDKLIASTTSGLTDVYINNTGGTGDQTLVGIQIVEVDNVSDSSGAFRLANGDFVIAATGEDAIIAGAFGYALRQGADGNWYLQSELIPTGGDVNSPQILPKIFQPAAPVYEALPQSLLGLINASTLSQRIEGRQMLTKTINSAQPTGTWLRISGKWTDIESDKSTTQASYKQQTQQLQIGIDHILNQNQDGKLVGGIYLSADKSSSKVNGIAKGDINSQGQRVGLTTTWYGNNDFYIDAQLQMQKLASDLSSNTLGTLSKDVKSSGQLLAVEVGKKFDYDHDLTITPQLQLTWKKIDFDKFTGPNGELVSLDKNSQNHLRIGLAVEKQWQPEKRELVNLYGIANVRRYSQDGSSVDISGTTLNMTLPEWTAEIGLGGSYDWQSADRTTSVYGEVSAEKAISGGDIMSIEGTIGVRSEW